MSSIPSTNPHNPNRVGSLDGARLAAIDLELKALYRQLCAVHSTLTAYEDDPTLRLPDTTYEIALEVLNLLSGFFAYDGDSLVPVIGMTDLLERVINE